MFFKTSTEEKINSLLKESAVRKTKINESIEVIDNQIKKLQNEITDLTDKYVSLELENDTAELKEIDKSIDSNMTQIKSLQGKKEAYSRLIDNDTFIKNTVPKIIESAKKDRKERGKELEKKIQEKYGLVEQIKQMEQKLKIIETEVEQLMSEKEVKQVQRILKYIESRKISIGHEEYYISALLDEAEKEYLDQHIEPEFRKFNTDELWINSLRMNHSIAVNKEDIEKEPENLVLSEIKYKN